MKVVVVVVVGRGAVLEFAFYGLVHSRCRGPTSRSMPTLKMKMASEWTVCISKLGLSVVGIPPKTHLSHEKV